MKSTVKRILATALAMAVMLAITVGCNKSVPSNGNPGSLSDPGGIGNSQNGSQISHEPTDEVYVAQYIPFLEDIGTISGLGYHDGKVYFVSTKYDVGNEETFYSKTYTSSIYSMNLDGSGLTQLSSYTPSAQRAEGDYGGVHINSVHIDNSGNLWIVERWDFYGFDLPSGFDRETGDAWQYRAARDSGTAVRKLDASGAQLLSVDLSALSDEPENVYVDAISTDSSGNVYLAVEGWENTKRAIYALDSGGSLQFKVEVEQWFDRLLQMADGSVAFVTYNERTAQTINFGAQALGEAYNLPDVNGNALSGGSGFDLLINDGGNLYGYAAAEANTVKLLNWIESNVSSDNIQNIAMLPDARIICTDYKQDAMTNNALFTLIILSKTVYSELPESNVITLAVFGLDDGLRDAVLQFNKDNPSITIQIIDYIEGYSFDNQDDFNNAAMRFATEIITGNIPDIVETSILPYREYAKKGFFADLYPFVDADPVINRDSFVDGVLRSSEFDGKLFSVFPSFTVNCIFGNPSVVGSDIGWTMEDFKVVLNNNPNADMPVGQYISGIDFLQISTSLSTDEFINWETGTAHFDSPGFVHLLEVCNTLPGAEYDESGRPIYTTNEDISQDEAIAAGRQILRQTDIFDFFNIQMYKTLFGGQLAIKGFPASVSSGITLSPIFSLAITENSRNKDAAWEFLKTMLDGDWQLRNGWALPANNEAFDFKVSQALGDNDYEERWAGPEMSKLTQADMDRVRAVISKAVGTASWHIDPPLWNIIRESAVDYFEGRCSAQEAANVIQSKAAIYVSERS